MSDDLNMSRQEEAKLQEPVYPPPEPEFCELCGLNVTDSTRQICCECSIKGCILCLTEIEDNKFICEECKRRIDMKEILEQFIELAKKWRSLSQQYHGWYTEEYTDKDLRVRCYFADNSNFSSVGFTVNNGHIEVYFHSPVQVNGFTVRSLGLLGAALANYEEFAVKTAAVLEQRDQKQIEAEKAAKIELLKRQLDELTSDTCKDFEEAGE